MTASAVGDGSAWPRQRLAAAYALLVAVYVATRLLLLWRFPTHFDEAVFADWTARGVADGGNQLFLPLTAGQQPLLEWLAAPLVHLGAGPLTALRLVSVAAGLVTMAAVAALASLLGGQRAALVAAGVWVILPFALVYTVVGFYDPLAAMFVTLALLLQVRLAREQRLDTALLLGLVLAGGLLTKLTASIALYLIPLSALLFDFAAPRAAFRLLRWLGALGLALAVAWGGYQVLKLSDFYDDLGAGREVLAQHGLGEALRHLWHWLAANWPTYQDALLGYLTVPLLVALAVGLAAGLRAHARLTLVLAGWSLLPLAAIVLLADFPYTRWLAVAVPPFAVLIAFGVLALVDAARRTRQGRHGMTAAALVATTVLAPALVLDARILATPETAPYPGDDLAAFVTGGSAGSVWDDVAADLRSRAAGRPVKVASGGLCCQSLALELSDDPSVTIVRADSDAAASALFAVENSVALPVREGELGWQAARTFSRPRDGVPVTLYESGVRYGAALATSPDSLREAIGGTDADYDAFVSSSPAVRAWVDAWYDAHPQDPTG